MKVYLAARYSRREELCVYRMELQDSGYIVTSRWLDGEHQVPGPELAEAAESEVIPPEAGIFAEHDFEDVRDADVLVCFSEPLRSGSGRSRGGRHVELGLALAWGIPIIVVGPRENVFHCLPQIHVMGTWPEVRALIDPRKAAYEALAEMLGSYCRERKQ